MLSGAEAAPGGNPEGSPVDASALGAAVRVNAGALELLVGAAEAGNTEAMNFLGVLYAIGSQVPRDYPMALYWFQKAIDSGSSDAMDNLARMYVVGMGVPRDYVNALRWFERAAVRGNVHSMYSTAVIYPPRAIKPACPIENNPVYPIKIATPRQAIILMHPRMRMALKYPMLILAYSFSSVLLPSNPLGKNSKITTRIVKENKSR
jgi:hypothetical protein